MRSKTVVRTWVGVTVLATVAYMLWSLMFVHSNPPQAQYAHDPTPITQQQAAGADAGAGAGAARATLPSSPTQETAQLSAASRDAGAFVESAPQHPSLAAADFPQDTAKAQAGEKKEWRGVESPWEGECPLRGTPAYGDLGVYFLNPPRPDPVRKEKEEARRKSWKPQQLPEHIQAEYANETRYVTPEGWETAIYNKGRQWFWVKNFCVKDGKPIFFNRRMGVETASDASHGKYEAKQRKKHLNLYNEFTRSRNKLSYNMESVPLRLPGPLVDNPGWIMSFWCQDLFHQTMTMMPGHAVKRFNNSDIYIKLCKKSPCRPKLGSQLSWDDPYNGMWNDRQFPFAGNPYWKMYRLLTDEPHKIRPLYSHRHYYPPDRQARCYREGVVDKKWFIRVSRQEAINYANEQLENFGIKRVPRQCRRDGGYRMTVINRQGASRRLGNIQEVSEAARCLGFNVTVVAFERFELKQQIEVIANTDLIVGMHGNGLIWTQFQEAGAYEIEIMGIWYERYAKLWGNGYNHTNMKDKNGVKGNEFRPFMADMQQMMECLRNAKEFLDRTSCGEDRYIPDMGVTHQNVWEEIMIRQHPELALPPSQRRAFVEKMKKQKALQQTGGKGTALAHRHEGSGSAVDLHDSGSGTLHDPHQGGAVSEHSGSDSDDSHAHS